MAGSEYSMANLANKYGNFMVPAFQVTCDGKNIVKEYKAQVENISVKLDLDSSSSAECVITNVYDIKERCFRSDIRDAVKMGTIITIELGYGSATSLVFKGYIYSIRFQMDDIPSISITAMDVRRLMEENYVNETHQGKKYSDIFEKVMENYNMLYETLEVEDTISLGDKENDEMNQESSDMDFVKRLCKKSNREFFVRGETVYFREPKKGETPIVCLENGRDIMSFSCELIHRDLKLIVKAILRDPPKPADKKRNVKTDENWVRALGKPITKVVDKKKVDNEEQLEEALNKEEMDIRSKGQSGSGTCIGLPEIVPGRYIEIEKMDPKLDGKYYLKSVTHSMDGNGYQTSFEIGGHE